MAPKTAKGKAEGKAEAKAKAKAQPKAKADPGCHHPASKFSLNKKEQEQVDQEYQNTLAAETAAGAQKAVAEEKAEEARNQLKKTLQAQKAARHADNKKKAVAADDTAQADGGAGSGEGAAGSEKGEEQGEEGEGTQPAKLETEPAEPAVGDETDRPKGKGKGKGKAKAKGKPKAEPATPASGTAGSSTDDVDQYTHLVNAAYNGVLAHRFFKGIQDLEPLAIAQDAAETGVQAGP